MVFEPVAILVHPRRQMFGEQTAGELQQAVAEVFRQEAQILDEGVEPRLHPEQLSDPARAQGADGQEGVLAVFPRDVVAVAVHIFAGDRQMFEIAQDVAPDAGQDRRIAGPDVEDARLARRREGVQPHREDHRLARAARRLEQPVGVGVEPGRAVGVHVADPAGVIAVRRLSAVIRQDFARPEVARLDAGEHRLGIVAQGHAQMIDQVHPPVRVDAGVKRHLGIGRAALDQRTARVVAHPAHDRCADAGRTDHRMRLASQRLQHPLQLIQRRAGQADHLPPALDQMHGRHPQGGDHHHRPVVIVSVGGRPAGQAGVGRLHDDDAACLDAGLEGPPLFDQRAGPHHRLHTALPKAIAPAVAARRLGIGQDMVGADDGPQPVAQLIERNGRARRGGGRMGGGHRITVR